MALDLTFRKLTANEAEECFNRLIQDGSMWAYAYDLDEEECTLQMWLDVYNNPLIFSCAFLINNELAGFAELMPFVSQTRAVSVNTGLFKPYYPYAKLLMNEASLWVLENLNGACCVGVTPVVNRQMTALLPAIGYKKIGTIPEYTWFNKKKKYVDAIITVATRTTLTKARNHMKE